MVTVLLLGGNGECDSEAGGRQGRWWWLGLVGGGEKLLLPLEIVINEGRGERLIACVYVSDSCGGRGNGY